MEIDPKNRDALCSLLEDARQYDTAHVPPQPAQRDAPGQQYADEIAEIQQLEKANCTITLHMGGQIYRSANAPDETER